MIFIGIAISNAGLKRVRFNRDAWGILFGRFLFAPIIMTLLVLPSSMPVLMKQVFILQSAMPVMTNAPVVSKMYNADDTYASIMVAETDEEVSSTLGVNCGVSTGRNGIVLNDQGGNRMDITEEVTSTLRAEAHHPPCVMESAGFCTEHSAKSRTIGYEEECSPTLRAGVVPAAVALENHPTDSRVKLSEDGNVQTLTSRMGTGGNNVPLVMKIQVLIRGTFLEGLTLAIRN